MSELNHSTITLINLIIHVCLAVIFLNSMFYFLVSSAEERSLNRMMKELGGETVLTNRKLLSENIKEKDLFLRTKNLNYTRYTYDDEIKKTNNDWLFSVMLITTISLIMIPFTILMSLKFICGYDLQLTHILLHNFLIVLFVISFEIYFILFIALYYIPVNPKTFSRELFDIIKESLVHEMKNLDEEKELDDDNIIPEVLN